MPRPSVQGGQPPPVLGRRGAEGHEEGCVFPHRRQKECRPASHIQCSITLDQQNTLSGSPKLIDLVDQSNLFPPSRPRATLGAVRMTRQASALGTGTSSTTVVPRIQRRNHALPVLRRPSLPPTYAGLHRGSRSRRESASRLCFTVAAPSPATPFSCPLSVAPRGRASHTTAGRHLPALHLGRRRGAGSESTRRGAYINSAGLD